MLISHVQSVSTVTWQRGGGGLGAGGTKELDVRGMKPASLPLLASSLGGKKRASESKSISSWLSSEY